MEFNINFEIEFETMVKISFLLLGLAGVALGNHAHPTTDQDSSQGNHVQGQYLKKEHGDKWRGRVEKREAQRK